MKLHVNQSLQFPVFARQEWNDSEIEISPGESYRLSASGRWRDLLISTDANGYSNFYMRLFDPLKRAKRENWFSLNGSLDKAGSFLIGKGTVIGFDKPGRLYLFANDVNHFYWNNTGQLTVTAKRLE